MLAPSTAEEGSYPAKAIWRFAPPRWRRHGATYLNTDASYKRAITQAEGAIDLY
jgi:hypothetical protein